MPFNNASACGQADTTAFDINGRVNAIKDFKNPGILTFRDTPSIISNRHRGLRARLFRRDTNFRCFF